MPKAVRTGHADLLVIVRPAAQCIDGEDGEFLGRYLPDESLIEIADNLGRPRRAEILMHEVLHALWDGSGLEGYAEEFEEDVITALAPRICGLLRDNPKFTHWVAESMGVER